MPWSEIDFSSFEQGLSLSTMEKIEQQILSIDSGVNEMVKRDRTANGYHSLDILKIKCIGVFEVGVAGSEAPSALLLSHLKKVTFSALSPSRCGGRPVRKYICHFPCRQCPRWSAQPSLNSTPRGNRRVLRSNPSCAPAAGRLRQSWTLIHCCSARGARRASIAVEPASLTIGVIIRAYASTGSRMNMSDSFTPIYIY